MPKRREEIAKRKAATQAAKAARQAARETKKMGLGKTGSTAKVVARQKRRMHKKIVVGERKGDGQVDDKADVKAKQCKEPKKHNLQAKITATKIRQAKTGNVRTYTQGQTIATAKQWILIAEISQAQPPDHHALMQQVMYHVFVL